MPPVTQWLLIANVAVYVLENSGMIGVDQFALWPPGGFDSPSALSLSGSQLCDSLLDHARAILQIYQFVHIAGRGGFLYLGFEIAPLCPALP